MSGDVHAQMPMPQRRRGADTGSNEGHMAPRVAHTLTRAVPSQRSRFPSNGSSFGTTVGVTFADRVELSDWLIFDETLQRKANRYIYKKNVNTLFS